MKDDILCVRGNCEAEVDQMVLEFPVMAEYAILTAGTRMIFATHGHVFNEKNLPPLHKGDILLHGHTHVPKCVAHENYIYMNPGSVSIPKENSYHCLSSVCFHGLTVMIYMMKRNRQFMLLKGSWLGDIV